jgi:hypothetical protein
MLGVVAERILVAWCGRRLLMDQFCCVSEFSFSPFILFLLRTFFFCSHYLFAADQRLCLIDHGFFIGISFILFIYFLVGGIVVRDKIFFL